MDNNEISLTLEEKNHVIMILEQWCFEHVDDQRAMAMYTMRLAKKLEGFE